MCVCVCEPFLLVCLWLVVGAAGAVVVVVSGVVKKYANAGARMMEWQCLPSGREIATSNCTEYPSKGVRGRWRSLSYLWLSLASLLPTPISFCSSLVRNIWQVECAAKCLLVPLSSANICVIRIFKPAPRNVFAKAQTIYTSCTRAPGIAFDNELCSFSD